MTASGEERSKPTASSRSKDRCARCGHVEFPLHVGACVQEVGVPGMMQAKIMPVRFELCGCPAFVPASKEG